MTRSLIIILSMAVCIPLHGHAQSGNTDGDFASRSREAVDGFRNRRDAVLEDFEKSRREALDDYIRFTSDPWKEFAKSDPLPKPKDDIVPPVVVPKKDDNDIIPVEPQPVVIEEDIVPEPVEPQPVVIEDVIVPEPVEPQPEPFEPIKEVPVMQEKYVDYHYFGTSGRVRFDMADRIHLRGVDERSVAEGIRTLSRSHCDNMILDCLSIRKEKHLCDWAYLLMIKELAESVYGENTNEAELLMAYIYMQSGYKMRLASDGSELYMLFASKHYIYEQSMFRINGDLYYCVKEMPSRLYVSDVAYPGEKSLSLYINESPLFDVSLSDERKIVSERYSDVDVSVSINTNLMDFFSTYPTSMFGDNECSRWAMYANTPMSAITTEMLYPSISRQIDGKSQLEAVNILLNWVQTGFVYGYDSEIWGGDRAFFAEESLYYPKCDCEDRSILFTRLVRDLLGMECILVYYPGHLASAVHFTETVEGDYILLNGKKYTIADPTYIGAFVGETMPDMDNSSADVILLK